MRKLLIVKDYKNAFWQTFPPGHQHSRSLDVKFLKTFFTNAGYIVQVTSYPEFDFQENYKDCFVIYGSSEDPIGGTKDYMEDVLLWLQEQGAILLPAFKYFRAHHNKVFMEMLRYNFSNEKLKNIRSKTFRSPDDIQDLSFNYPVVIKSASGAGSSGVFLAKNKMELFTYAKHVSKIPSLHAHMIWFLRRVKRIIDKREPPPSRFNVKFIIQDFIPNLPGDYKVLVFGDHYFVLHRLHKKHDFRASGAGIFAPPNENELNAVLDYAKFCVQEIMAPCISLDIAISENECFLFEFQCVSFGFKTMSWAKDFYEYNNETQSWHKKSFQQTPEEEFCYAVNKFIQENYK